MQDRLDFGFSLANSPEDALGNSPDSRFSFSEVVSSSVRSIGHLEQLLVNTETSIKISKSLRTYIRNVHRLLVLVHIHHPLIKPWN